jgi:hypothetical protein
MTHYLVTNKETNKVLTDEEIIEEVNRDRSEEWQPYTIKELHDAPFEVTAWIDSNYYHIEASRV